MAKIGQYLYKNVSGTGRLYVSPGFESYNRTYGGRRAVKEGQGLFPALIYDRTEDYFFLGGERELLLDEKRSFVRHGVLIPRALFEGKTYGTRLYRFFDIDGLCAPGSLPPEDTLPPVLEKLSVREGAAGYLSAGEIFDFCREGRLRFVRLLISALLLALTENCTAVISVPAADGKRYEKKTKKLLQSIMAVLPMEMRDYLTFHSCMEDTDSFGSFKVCLTPLPLEALPPKNRLFYFDFASGKVVPGLVIEQKSRGTVLGELLYLIWSDQNEKALASLFNLFHANRELLAEDRVVMTEADAFACYFLLTPGGEKYRPLMEDAVSRVSKTAAREMMLFLAGHLEKADFIALRRLLHLS